LPAHAGSTRGHTEAREEFTASTFGAQPTTRPKAYARRPGLLHDSVHRLGMSPTVTPGCRALLTLGARPKQVRPVGQQISPRPVARRCFHNWTGWTHSWTPYRARGSRQDVWLPAPGRACGSTGHARSVAIRDQL